MKLNQVNFIAAVVAALHLAGLSFAFGAWHWKYLLVTAISGATLWGVLPRLLPQRRWISVLIGLALALVMQQAAFWLWRAKLGGFWWALAQFVAIHFLVGLTLERLRQRRPSTFVSRGTMLKQGRQDPTSQNEPP